MRAACAPAMAACCFARRGHPVFEKARAARDTLSHSRFPILQSQLQS